MQISGVNTPTGADARQPESGSVSTGHDETTGHGVPDLFSDVLRTLTALDDSGVTHTFEDSSVDTPDASRKPGNGDETPDDVHPEILPHPDEQEISRHEVKSTEPFTNVPKDAPPETTEAPRPETINRHVTINFGAARDGKSPAGLQTIPFGEQLTGTSDQQPRDPAMDQPAPRWIDTPGTSRKPRIEEETPDGIHPEILPHPGEEKISRRDGKPAEPFTSVTKDAPPETTEAPRPETINRHVTIHFGAARDDKSPAGLQTIPFGGQFDATSDQKPGDPAMDEPAPRSIDTPGTSRKPRIEDETPDGVHPEILPHPSEEKISRHEGKSTEPFKSAPKDAPPETAEAPRLETVNRHVTSHFRNAGDGKSPAVLQTIPFGGQFDGTSDHRPGDPVIDEPARRLMPRLATSGPGKLRPERDTRSKAPRNVALPSGGMMPPLHNTPEPTGETSHAPVPAGLSGAESLAVPVSRIRAANRFPPFLQPGATPPDVPEYGGSSQPDYVDAAPDLVPTDRSAGHSIPRHGTDPLLARMPADPTVATRTVRGANAPMTDSLFRSDAPPALPRTLPPVHDTKATPSVGPETRRTVPRRTAPEIGPAEAPAQGKATGIDRGHADKKGVFRNMLPLERQTQQAMHNDSNAVNTAQLRESNRFRPTENPLISRETVRAFHPADVSVYQPREPIPDRNPTRTNDPLPLDRGDGGTRMTQPRIRASESLSGHQPHGRWGLKAVNGAEPAPARPPTQAKIPPDTTVTLAKPARVAAPALKTPKLPRPSVNDPASTLMAAGSQPAADPANPGVAVHQLTSQAPPLAISLTSPSVSHTASAVFAARTADVLGQNRDRKIDISLHPRELGHVRMSMAMSDSGVTVTIAADRSETLDLMRRHIDNLSTALQSLGHHSVAFQFSDPGNRQPQTGDAADPEPRFPDEPGPEPTPGNTVQTNQTRDLDLRL